MGVVVSDYVVGLYMNYYGDTNGENREVGHLLVWYHFLPRCGLYQDMFDHTNGPFKTLLEITESYGVSSWVFRGNLLLCTWQLTYWVCT